ncbi:MAG: aldo/keto reductase [Spirochaetota bacterium]
MKKRKLGKSDIEVSPIGLGTWQFSKGKGFVGGFWQSLDDDTTAAVVKAALDKGISWFDTAEVYGQGHSEKSLSKSLVELGVKPGSVGIATKWWPLFRTSRNIARTIGERLDFLSPYPIDLYQVHQPLSFSSVAKQLDAMGDLVAMKKVRAIGVSNFSAVAMEESAAVLSKRGIPLASNQVRISLLDRSIETNGLLEAAKRLGVSLIAYSPLAQGILSGRFHDDPASIASVTRMRRMRGSFKPETLARTAPLVAELKRIAGLHDATPSQIALNWVINFWGDTVVAIPGASKPKQAEEAAGAMSFLLSPSELASLDEISRQAAPVK